MEYGSTVEEALDNIQNKADWEGGWLEFLLGYGAPVADMKAIDRDWYQAFWRFENAWAEFEVERDRVYTEHGVTQI
jgi:hypothetical protein